MGKRHKEWARNARRDLIQVLGSECLACGSSELLHFDCITPQGDQHHRMSTDQRMCFYRKQHRIYNNVQLLCGKCHSLKSAHDARCRLPPRTLVANRAHQIPATTPPSPSGGAPLANGARAALNSSAPLTNTPSE